MSKRHKLFRPLNEFFCLTDMTKFAVFLALHYSNALKKGGLNQPE